MWHRLLICGSILALAILALVAAGSVPATALAGCCKERKEITDRWKITRHSLEKCMSENTAKNDKDNVMQQSGKIWWDIAC